MSAQIPWLEEIRDDLNRAIYQSFTTDYANFVNARMNALIAIACSAEDLAPWGDLGDGDRMKQTIQAAKETP